MNSPLIGITLDIEKPEEGKFSKYHPWYALRENYSGAVAKHGATPVLLPHHVDLVDSYLDKIDGVITTGGDFDIDPALYGDNEVHPETTMKKDRTTFEFALLKSAIKRNIPILGICGGEQLINVVCGGTLIQHIPDTVESDITHEGLAPTGTVHEIKIREGTKLNSITGVTSLQINSTHHQAVKAPGDGMVVSATAPDGVIEAVEYPEHPFCIGVQWHPEYELNEAETKLFEVFVTTCRGT